MKRLLIGIKNILLWSYARGTWQYDILCLLIVAAVFLLPGSFFGDRDRPLSGKIIAAQAPADLKVASKDTVTTQWHIALEELKTFSQIRGEATQLENHPREMIVLYLREHLKREVALHGIEEERDSQGRMIGYRVRFQ